MPGKSTNCFCGAVIASKYARAISGVATKTTYATFLLYSLFNSGVLKEHRANTRALFFNVKGEDLLYLDKKNRELVGDVEKQQDYARLSLEPGGFFATQVVAHVGFQPGIRRSATTALVDERPGQSDFRANRSR